MLFSGRRGLGFVSLCQLLGDILNYGANQMP